MRGIMALVAVVVIAGLLVGVGCAARNEVYPARPITCVVSHEAGSPTDTMGRALFEIAQKKLGQPIAVVNKPGAAGTTAQREVHDSKPDGYTIGLTATLHVVNAQGLIEYDYRRDYDVIGVPAATATIIIAPASSPWQTLEDAVKYARENPGKLKVATASKGAMFWIATKLFERTAGVEFNILPQPGGGGMVLTQVAGGHADLGFTSVPGAKGLISAGQVRVLATMGATRDAQFPDVPTLKELGYDVRFTGPITLFGPKGMPNDVYRRLVSVIAEAAQDPAYGAVLQAQGAWVVAAPGPDQAIKYLDEELEGLKPLLEQLRSEK